MPVNPVSHGRPKEPMFLSFTRRRMKSKKKNPRTNPLLVSSLASEEGGMMNQSPNLKMTTLNIIENEDIDKTGIRVKSVNMTNLLREGCLKTLSTLLMNQESYKKLILRRLLDTGNMSMQ